MSAILWAPFLSYTAVTAITPGPNNILAMSSTVQHGWRQSRRLLAGICTGFLTLMLLCGAFSAILSALLSSLTVYLTYAGAAYILWLAWHVWRSSPPEEGYANTNNSFLRGFVLQFANVKIILASLTSYMVFLPREEATLSTVVGFALIMTAMGMGGTLIWASVGSALRSLLQKHWKLINLVLALLLAYTAVKLILS